MIHYLDNITERFDEGAQKMSYCGIRVAQKYGVWHALDALHDRLIKDEQDLSRILEIGTNFGGFTKLLRDHPISSNAEVITFDVVDKGLHPVFKGTDIVFYQQDVFKNEKQIGGMIRRAGTTLLICDGGNKPREFQTFAKYLKRGDIIMGHDYAPNHQVFNEKIKGKLWNWCELQESDITLACTTNNLQPYEQEIFAEYVWAIRQKQ